MKLAVLCSGGDAPGMNAAVWRLAAGAEASGWEVVGFAKGYAGLLSGDAFSLTAEATARHARYGGASLGVARVPDLPDRIDKAVAALSDCDALVVIGGDGSLAGAGAIGARWRRPVVGLPATIDNDIAATDLSIGHDTALAFGLDAADRQRDSAEALARLFCLETLGGPTGHLAATIGRLAGAQAILIPEAPVSAETVVTAVRSDVEAERPTLIVVSEGYPDLHAFLMQVCDTVGMRLRLTSLGHAQRGGSPTPRDRALAAAFAGVALDAVSKGRSGMTVLRGGTPELADFGRLGETCVPDLTRWRGLL